MNQFGANDPVIPPGTKFLTFRKKRDNEDTTVPGCGYTYHWLVTRCISLQCTGADSCIAGAGSYLFNIGSYQTSVD